MKKERYRLGSHNVTDFQYHFVWKTKYAYKVLKDEIALRLRDIIREICSENGMDIVKGNIRPNHIHILVRGPSHLSSSKMLQYLKGKSSYRLQREFRELQKKYWGQHLWARGYFGATVGAVSEEQIKEYIENQIELAFERKNKQEFRLVSRKKRTTTYGIGKREDGGGLLEK
jgi:putative transposase